MVCTDPSASTLARLDPRAATMSRPTGTAEVTWPFRVSVLPAAPRALSTRISRVSLRSESSSVNWENTASSPVPQPGEK
ncbi:hypothetical protein ACIBI8_29590 [Streptomyces sp. NPDC050529]|uniref:hypothetical protein n=1 Tax=Streptomyces sp. NPDC050529 TaxID=3365624 RepID=UPI00378F4311